MQYGYIYKITATDINSNLVNHYYLGQKKYRVNESLFDPNGTYYYHGSSSILKRDYWPYYSEHKKEILEWADDAEELNRLEMKYISNSYKDPLCLNIAHGGHIVEYDNNRCNIQKLGAIKRWQNTEERERQSKVLKQAHINNPNIAKNISKIRSGVNQFANETQEQHENRCKKMSIAVNKFCHEEEYIEKCRASAKKKWEDPDFVEKMKNSRPIAAQKMLETWKKNGTSFKGEKNPAFGRKWMHNKIDHQVYVKYEDVNDYINKGYIFGKLKHYIKISNQTS